MTLSWTTYTREKRYTIQQLRRIVSVKLLILSLKFKALARQNIKKECCVQMSISKMFESTELRKVGI